jgi:hypothetical protein
VHVVELAGDALVIRFAPMSPAGLLRSAQKEARRTSGHHGLSVFAAVTRRGEPRDSVIGRLLQASELAGVNAATNSRYYVCVQAEELLSRGFTFWKDESDAEELPEHYNVDLGTEPGVEDAERFRQAFGPTVRRLA